MSQHFILYEGYENVTTDIHILPFNIRASLEITRQSKVSKKSLSILLVYGRKENSNSK